MFSDPINGIRNYGRLTQNANTVIDRLIEPMIKSFTRLTKLWYNAAATAHTLTIMRPLNRVSVSADAAAAQAVINITADPGKYDAFGTISVANNLIAANDYVVYQCADGTFVLDTVNSVSTLAITMTNNVPTATVKKGAPFWWFGITTDKDPKTNLAHEFFNCPANTVSIFDDQLGFFGSRDFASVKDSANAFSSQWPLDGRYEPLIVHSNNATNQGFLELVSAVYTSR